MPQPLVPLLEAAIAGLPFHLFNLNATRIYGS